MPFVSIFRLRVTICSAVAVCAGGILVARAADEPVKNPDNVIAATPEARVSEARASEGQNRDTTPVPIAVARDRAKLMHDIYLTTLDVMHDRYFHADRAIVPARAMEDVFSEMENQTGSRANWISVNLKAMSIDHEPQTEFEKRAATNGRRISCVLRPIRRTWARHIRVLQAAEQTACWCGSR